MLPLLRIFVASVVLAAPVSAFGWNAQNGLVVTPTGEATFTVPYRGASSIQAFWCAAGDYTVRELLLPGSTQIYRTSPVPRRAGQGIAFSLIASDSVGRTGLAALGRPSSISANHARTLCNIAGASDDE